MKFFSATGIVAKIMLATGSVAFVAVLVAMLGIASLRWQSQASEGMETASRGAMEAAKVMIHATSLNAAEFQLSGDPTERTVNSVRERVTEHLAELKKHFQTFRELVGPADAASADQLAGLVHDYERELEVTLRAADDAAGDGTVESVARLRREAEISHEVIGRLMLVAKSFTRSGEARISAAARSVASMYERAYLVLAVTSAIGIAAGIGFGYYVAFRGIVAPIRSVVDVLERLADGQLPPDIEGTDRTDEVGRIAAAAVVLRDKCMTLRRIQEGGAAGQA